MAGNRSFQMVRSVTEGRVLNVYHLYGMAFRSSIDLHLSTTDITDIDVRVTVNGSVSDCFPEGLKSDHFDVQYQRLFWPFAGAAEIYDGRDVVLTPLPNIDPSIFSFAVLGPVVALILHHKKFLTLHASCASMNGRAVAFMGDKGAGKSTMMAAVLASGHQLVADDIAAIKRHGKRDMCLPGYPLMKISDASMTAFPTLLSEAGQLIPTTVGDKSLVRVPAMPCDDVPMTALFVLKRGGEPALRRLGVEEAYGSLMRFSYPIRFGAGILKTEGSKDYMAYSARIASELPMYELTVAEGFQRYTEVVNLVEQAALHG